MFEALCHGTTNPWGHDWDEYGEAFFINTVNGHLWHAIPGAHFRRPHTIDPNPRAYALIDQHADHWHWDTAKDWSDSRKATGEHDRRGGGHAHSGVMIYLGDQWPAAYRGKLFTLNFHGRRANVERLERVGSGYVGRHEPDSFFAARPVVPRHRPELRARRRRLRARLERHRRVPRGTGVHRNSGRIYRIRYGEPKPVPAQNLTKLTQKELIDLLCLTYNEWVVRQVRCEWANRNTAGKLDDDPFDMIVPLEALLKSKDARNRLRGLLAFTQVITLYKEPPLNDGDEHMRAWTIRLLSSAWPLDTVMSSVRSEGIKVPSELLSRFVTMAREDASGLVRLTLASTLQRLPVEHRPALAAALLSRAEDATDANLPFLIWYGLIPVAEKNPEALVPLAAEGKFPAVRIWTARRLSEMLATNAGPLTSLLSRTGDKPEAVRRDIVGGMVAGFAGVRKATPPASWKTFSKDFTGPDADAMRSKVQGLDVVFGDGRALDDVRRIVLDDKADLNLRKAALKSFIEAKPDDLRAVCEKLLKTRFLNAIALQGLTQFDDPAVAKLMAANVQDVPPSERPAVIEALASRPTFAAELLALVASGTVPRNELTAFQARQIRGFDKPELTKRLGEVWGEMRDSPKDKADLIAKLKGELTPARIAAGNKSHGRAVFSKTCASCHKLFGTGAEIGPDLTGAGRKDLDYLLSNIVDPSAVVSKDFQMTVLNLADGRTLNGIVVVETDRAVTLQTDKERVVIAKADVEKRSPSPLSLMPDGLTQPFTPEQVRDLMAYLMADGQVELPPGEK